MAYAAPYESAPSRSLDRRKIGAFIMAGTIHLLAILALSWWHFTPDNLDAAIERVQAVEFTEPADPLPEIEPQSERRDQADDDAAGGGDDQLPSPKIAHDRTLLASVPTPIEIGFPLPRIPLARPTPALIGGGAGRAAGAGSQPGAGSGEGSGTGTGGTGNGEGSPLRKLDTRWAPSMDFRRLRQFYPPAALAERLPGQVVLECTVIRDDRVKDCVARAAGPVGRGFEQAAVEAQGTFRVQVTDQDGERVYDERILIRAFFRPETARR